MNLSQKILNFRSKYQLGAIIKVEAQNIIDFAKLLSGILKCIDLNV